jgi:hypothetical protein
MQPFAFATGPHFYVSATNGDEPAVWSMPMATVTLGRREKPTLACGLVDTAGVELQNVQQNGWMRPRGEPTVANTRCSYHTRQGPLTTQSGHC